MLIVENICYQKMDMCFHKGKIYSTNNPVLQETMNLLLNRLDCYKIPLN